MAHNHHHHHHHMPELGDEQSVRYKETVRITLIGSVIDLLLGVAKIVVGFIAQSQALIADGVHSLSDLATDGMVLYAAKHASRDADEEHPYGHGRIETVATVGLGAALIGVSIGIGLEALQRLFHPETLAIPTAIALVVAAISIVAKEVIYRYTLAVARKYKSKMLEANAWHSRSDAISSFIVVVGVGGSMAGLHYLDAVAAIGVAVMIAKIGWELGFHSVKELVDTSLAQERVQAIQDSILGVDGVSALHILRTRSMGGDALVDVHIQVEPDVSVSEAHYISEKVRSQVIKEIEEVADVMVHIDPEDDETIQMSARLPLRTALTGQLETAWSQIPAAAQIKHMRLHYLEGKIHIELLLPLSLLSDFADADALEAQFTEAVKDIAEIGSVSTHFR